MIGKLLAFFGLGGLSLKASLAIAAAAVIAAGAVVFGIWKAGYNYRDAQCDAELLREEVAQWRRLAAAKDVTIAEKDRQVAAVNEIAARDAKRAADAEAENRKNQEGIDETPTNDRVCLDRDGSRRVRGVR